MLAGGETKGDQVGHIPYPAALVKRRFADIWRAGKLEILQWIEGGSAVGKKGDRMGTIFFLDFA